MKNVLTDHADTQLLKERIAAGQTGLTMEKIRESPTLQVNFSSKVPILKLILGPQKRIPRQNSSTV